MFVKGAIPSALIKLITQPDFSDRDEPALGWVKGDPRMENNSPKEPHGDKGYALDFRMNRAAVGGRNSRAIVEELQRSRPVCSSRTRRIRS